MIWARDTYGIDVGWGTAIPSCLNEKLVECGMESDCGAGVTFAAVNPNGDVRICNQSMHVYGNLLSGMSFHDIWHQKEIDEFRDLAWTCGTICEDCPSLPSCLGGCKVDASIEGEYSVDYSIREKQMRPAFVDHVVDDSSEPLDPVPTENRHFSVNLFTRLHDVYPEKYAVTQFQTVLLDEDGVTILKYIINHGVTSETALKQAFTKKYSEDEISRFVTNLVAIAAIDLN
jgi:radical SAM protein with 4Fe4S-binding SPASM domain